MNGLQDLQRWPHGVRPIHVKTPDAAQLSLLEAFAHRLTPEQSRLRFAGLRKLERSDEVAGAFQCGWEGHEMVWALDGSGSVVGVANCARIGRAGLGVGLVVRPDRTRQGIGLALLEHIKRWARARGFAKLCGTVLWENWPTRALARKAGFRSVGVGGVTTQIEAPLDASEGLAPLGPAGLEPATRPL
jgi:GNAT superfamily N-acetyltransferase